MEKTIQFWAMGPLSKPWDPKLQGIPSQGPPARTAASPTNPAGSVRPSRTSLTTHRGALSTHVFLMILPPWIPWISRSPTFYLGSARRMDFVSRMPERFYWMYLYKTHQNLVKCSVNLLTVCITLFLLRIGLVPRFLWSPTHQRSSPPHHRVRLVNVSGKAANGCGRYIIQGSTCRFIFDNSRGQSYPKEFGGDWFWNHEKYDWWLMFSSSKSYPDQKLGVTSIIPTERLNTLPPGEHVATKSHHRGCGENDRHKNDGVNGRSKVYYRYFIETSPKWHISSDININHFVAIPSSQKKKLRWYPQ